MNVLFWMISILLPAVAVVFLGIWDKKDPRSSTKLLLWVEIMINLLIVLIRMRMGDAFTNYEYLLGNAISSATVAQLFGMVAFQRKITCLETLKTICFICLAVAVYSALTMGQAIINSDTATSTLLTQSQIAHRSFFPKTWNYVNGEIWTLGIQTFVAPFAVLLKNQTLARAMGSALAVVATAAAILFFCRMIFKDESWTIAIPLTVIFIEGYGAKDQILYEASYIGLMLWMALGVSLFYLAVSTGKPKYALCYLLLPLILCAGGTRFILEQTIPLWLGYACFIYFEIRNDERIQWREQTRRFIYTTALLFIPAIIGLCIHKWFSSKLSVHITANNTMILVGSLSAFWSNLLTSVLHMFECFGYFGGNHVLSLSGLTSMVSITVCLLVCLIVPVLQGLKLRLESREVRFFYCFGIIHNVCMLVAKAALGLMDSPRYMLSTIFVFILISSRYICVYWIGQKSFRKRIWTSLFALAAAIECLMLVASGMSWNAVLSDKKAFNQELVDYGLSKGYASYWNAYNNQVYSDMKLKFGGIQISAAEVNRFSWLVDENVFIPEHGMTFLMLNDSENEMLGPNIHLIFGEPVDAFDSHGLHIYVFDHDIALDFPGDLSDGIVKPIEFSKNENVSLTGNALELVQGGVVFGPCGSLGSGNYDIEFSGDNMDQCECDIYSNAHADAIQYQEVSRSEDKVVLRLSLREDVEDIEFRTYNNIDGDSVRLDAVYIDEAA